MHQYATLEDTIYLWFGANDTAGTGADGASAVFDVREGGASSSGAPVLSGSATLLTHANYPDGSYEVAIAATAGNGFAANKSYGVFCSLAIDGANPTGFIGSFRLGPVPANATHIGGTQQTGRDIGASVLLSPGTGTGQISLSSGAVTVGTNNDKTGYALSQAFPANFASLSINGSGHISRVTLTDTATTLTNAPSDSSGVTTLLSRVSANVLLAGDYVAPDNVGIAAIQAVTDNLDTALELDGSVYRFTENALELAPSGGSVSGGDLTVEDIVAGIVATYPDNFSELLITAEGYLSRVVLVDTCSTNDDYTAAPTALENADALLKRDWTAISGDPASRSVWNALRILRNRWYFDGNTQHITEEDDTAVAWSQVVGTTSGAAAVTSTNPA